MTSASGLEARARAGDGLAFGELIEQWDDDLRGIVWSVVRSGRDTDDVMQAAYDKAFRGLSNFRRDSSLKTWLCSICLRTAVDHSRYEQRRRHESTDQLASLASSESTSGLAISRAELAQALDQLDIESRSLLMMTVGLGYSFDEVAEIAGIPRGTVASRVARAKKKIRAAGRTDDREEAAR